METKEGIIKEIKEYIDSKGNQKNSWYVIITDTPSKIFQDFNVKKDDGFWIYITADSNRSAMSVRESLISEGLMPGTFEEGDDYKIVVAYKLTK